MIKIFSLLVLLMVLLNACQNEPYEGEIIIIENPDPCELAIEETEIAESNFNNATYSDYSDLCLAYKEALQNQINVCGDPDGSLLAIVNGLGDCFYPATFQVDFDGQTFVADNAIAAIADGVLTITGERGNNGETVTIVVNRTTPGTYQLGLENSNNEVNLATYENETGDTWQSFTDGNMSLGEVALTEIDFDELHLSGQFQFTGYHTTSNEIKEFTNGIFVNIPFTKENEFFAKVDGVEFVDINIVPYMSNFEIVGLNAQNVEGATIDIAVSINIIPGTYNFAVFPGLPAGEYTPSLEDFHYGEGTLTITTHNQESKLLIGAFEFTAEPFLTGVGTYEITEGSFCINYN